MPRVGARRSHAASPASESTLSISLELAAARPPARAGRSPTATMSRSLTLSASRRAEPASSTRCGAGAARAPHDRARRSRWREAAAGARAVRRRSRRPSRASAASSAASTFGPNPLTVRRRCAVAASRRASGESMPELVEQQARPLGPEPGQARDRDQARRILARAASSGRDRAGLREREDLLLHRRADPRQLGRAPWRASAATETGASRTALAASGRRGRGG